MFGMTVIKRGSPDEAEKPFWISFADMMTALMVLFLVTMSVALVTVTKTVSELERQKADYERDVKEIMRRFTEAARKFKGIKVDEERHTIDFGDRARFDLNSYKLSDKQESSLREFLPEMLNLANDEIGARILKRFVVEGYTDTTGSYLHNLNLSLQRGQRVLCALLSDSGPKPLSYAQKEDVQDLFLVGGYSFNSAKANADESRRVEMRLEFLGIGEQRTAGKIKRGNFGKCQLQ
jgi:outer membrane protein OmpA-like peptidoglycan-associated protein